MKKLSPIFLFLAIAAGAFGIHEYRLAEHYRALVAQMDKDAAGAREENDSQATELRKLKDQTHSQKVAIEQLEARNKELASAPASEGAKPTGGGSEAEKGGGFMKSLAKVFNDPKSRDAMRAQQAAAVTMMYASLGKELGLAPDVARQVLAILGDRQADMAAQGMAMMSGDKKDLDALGKETAKTREAYDDQLKGILGDDGFKKLGDYEKTIGDRFALDQIQRQLSASGTALEPAQSQGLLSIMKEERARSDVASPMSADPAQQGKFIQDEAAADKWMNAQAEMNRRVIDRARTLLTPDQLNAFQTAQKQQLDMQQMGIRMSREMFKGGGK
jgi:hypothetical protein